MVTPAEAAQLEALGLVEPRALLPAVPTRPSSGATIATAWGQAVHDATFGAATILDVREGWSVLDIVTTTADGTPFSRFGLGTSNPPQGLAAFAGAVIGIAWRLSAGISTGTLRLQAKVGSTVDAQVITATSASGASSSDRFATPIPFAASAHLAPVYGTTSGFAPSGSLDLYVQLLVAYDYSATP